MRLRGLVELLDIFFKVRFYGENDVLIGVVGLDVQGINSIDYVFGGCVPVFRSLEQFYLFVDDLE